MAKAFICDLSGAQCAGEPKKMVEVVGKKFKAELRLYRKADAATFVEADIGPETAEKLAAAIKAALPKDA